MAEVSSGDGAVRWSLPERGRLKVNVDAAVFSGKQEIGVGIVVRDCSGKIIQARHINLLGSFSPRHAEIIGIREALSWLKGSDHLVIESDAMEVILELRNRDLAEPDLLAAHILAQKARYLSGHQEWFNNFSEFLTSVTVSDLI
ncbi:uncharacterized protein LOC126687897 [Mercurialis annua]|uniref:uncharacterized protein LOC126687897 n=1 Tax=Mercurialis annua TaxID=3986 RepID=UPI00215E4426|nr:uncharacterized protein LOC126687897 [Mercurialis annua]